MEPSFVYLPGVAGGEAIAKETGLDFFSVPIELGVRPLSMDARHQLVLTVLQPSGVEKAHNILGEIDENEKKLLEACKNVLKGNIEKGVEFVHNPPPKWIPRQPQGTIWLPFPFLDKPSYSCSARSSTDGWRLLGRLWRDAKSDIANVARIAGYDVLL